MTRLEFEKAMADLPPAIEPNRDDCEFCLGEGKIVVTSADANQLGVAWVFAWVAAGGEGENARSIRCIACKGTGKKDANVR